MKHTNQPNQSVQTVVTTAKSC